MNISHSSWICCLVFVLCISHEQIIGQTIVVCPNPPGGTVRCESNQMAACRVANGQIDASCVNVSSELKGLALSDFLKDVILDLPKLEGKLFTSNQVRDSLDLQKGSYSFYGRKLGGAQSMISIKVNYVIPENILRNIPLKN